jgi:hypothetical protein
MENVGSEMWEMSKYGKYGVGTCPLFEKRTGVFEITFPQRSPETENRKTVKIVRFPAPREYIPPIPPTSTCPRCGMIHDRRYTTGRSVSRKEARGWGTQVPRTSMDRPAATGVIQPRFAELARDEGAE